MNLSNKKTLLILEFLEHHKSLSVEEICEKTGFSKLVIENLFKKDYVLLPSKMNKKNIIKPKK